MNPILDSASWLDSPKGQYLLSCEQAWCDQALEDVFGFHALQLGLPQLRAMRNNRIAHRWTAGIRGWNSGSLNSDLCFTSSPNAVQMVLSGSHLPFSNETFDLMVLPHALELSEDPGGCLREVYRVLRPQGQVLILGFQPWSLSGLLWNLWQRYARVPGLSEVQVTSAVQAPWPYRSSWISRHRIKDWLELLDFEIIQVRSGMSRPPINGCLNVKIGASSQAENSSGFGFEHWMGALYMVRAVKRVPGVRWMSPAWKKTQARMVPAASNVRIQKDFSKDRS